MNEPSPEKLEEKKPGFWQIVMSTLAAFIGVQSNKNRERDFKHGSIGVYITAGIIFVAVFIAVIITIVKLVLGNLT